MQGIQCFNADRNGFRVIRLHYSADPEKNEAWATQMRKGMPIDGWEREYEINLSSVDESVRFFTEFTEEKHVRELDYNPDLPLVLSWDPGYRMPACTMHQIDAAGHWLVLDEAYGSNVTWERFTTTTLEYLIQKYGIPAWRLKHAYDIAAHQTNTTSEYTALQILMAVLQKFQGENHQEIDLRSQRLDPETSLQPLLNRLHEDRPEAPRFFINRNCTVLIEALSGNAERDKTNPNVYKRDGFYEHGLDTLRYFSANYLDYMPENVVSISRARVRSHNPYDAVGVPRQGTGVY